MERIWYFYGMDGTRVGRAIGRIETALVRIERAAAAIPEAPAEDPKLAERNRILESTLRESVSELDHLINRLDT